MYICYFTAMEQLLVGGSHNYISKAKKGICTVPHCEEILVWLITVNVTPKQPASL